MKKSHGLTNSEEYKIWCDMKTRCFNENHRNYKNYGARGITVCQEWVDSFEYFLAHMGSRPSKKHSVERSDSNGNYEPSNCRWATDKEQARNKRNNVYAVINGEKKLLVEWAEISGVPITAIRSRLLNGKTGEDLIKPKGSITYKGVTATLKEWSEKTGLKPSTIAMRINKYGWSVEKTLTFKAKRKVF